MGTHLAAMAATALLMLTSLGTSIASARTFGRIESSFELPQIAGNPFDFTVNDVRVTLASPSGKTIDLPAFFDGGTTWRVRHAPDELGRWTVKSVTLNGKPADTKTISPREFDVAAKPSTRPTTQPAMPGAGSYVRIDPKDKMRFAFDDGTPYYPIGYDLAWHHTGEPKMGPLTESIAKMSDAGVTWTRIWMNAWDGKNLDWVEPTTASPKPGTLDLGVAKHWDEIFSALEAGNVRFQLVLQHHGQYSTTADSNWAINPWNTANGGFLDSPEKFFSDEQTKKISRAKYRYIIARYGYSPAIMAWELFNEVQFTDAFKSDLPAVASWHADMATFLREQDPYKHLITTSSQTSEPTLWPAMDYYQDHVYAPDLVTAVFALESKKLDKPYFWGEIGSNAFGTQNDPGEAIHTSLWSSLMTNQSGGAMYWYWYEAEPRGLLYHYTAAQAFLKATNLAERRSSLKPIEIVAETSAFGPLKFGPGSGWAPSKGTSFNVKRSGTVEGLGELSAYLQGKGENNKMFPFAELNVDYRTDGTFAVAIDEITPAGATLNVSLDGKPVTNLTFPATPPPATNATARERRNPRVNATLEIPVPAGKHVIKLENNGGDWIHLRQFTLSPYTAQLGVVGKGSDDFAVMWVYRREAGSEPLSGTLTVPGLKDGDYRVVWFDTTKGTPIREATATAKDGLTIDSGPVAADVAIYVTRVGT